MTKSAAVAIDVGRIAAYDGVCDALIEREHLGVGAALRENGQRPHRHAGDDARKDLTDQRLHVPPGSDPSRRGISARRPAPVHGERAHRSSDVSRALAVLQLFQLRQRQSPTNREQLVAMQPREALEQATTLRRQLDDDRTPIPIADSAPHETCVFATRDERYGTVMLRLQSLGEPTNGRFLAARVAFDLKQYLILQRRHAVAAGDLSAPLPDPSIRALEPEREGEFTQWWHLLSAARQRIPVWGWVLIGIGLVILAIFLSSIIAIMALAVFITGVVALVKRTPTWLDFPSRKVAKWVTIVSAVVFLVTGSLTSSVTPSSSDEAIEERVVVEVPGEEE